mmetsp:Transcript_46155/g.100032  ORF Transcript_46155/g.100032 Transcript_46155/m.100032 type:complete len:300 (+) Transcript_46155:226-1125(+)
MTAFTPCLARNLPAAAYGFNTRLANLTAGILASFFSRLRLNAFLQRFLHSLELILSLPSLYVIDPRCLFVKLAVSLLLANLAVMPVLPELYEPCATSLPFSSVLMASLPSILTLPPKSSTLPPMLESTLRLPFESITSEFSPVNLAFIVSMPKRRVEASTLPLLAMTMEPVARSRRAVASDLALTLTLWISLPRKVVVTSAFWESWLERTPSLTPNFISRPSPTLTPASLTPATVTPTSALPFVRKAIEFLLTPIPTSILPVAPTSTASEILILASPERKPPTWTSFLAGSYPTRPPYL